MKFWIGVVAVVILATCAGYGWTSYEFRGVREEFGLGAISDELSKPTGGVVVAEVPNAEFSAGTDFDFGTKEQHITIPHSFSVKNTGNGTLIIDGPSPSCSACVHSKFERIEVPPGGTAELPVEFITRKPGPDFRETLEISTNDPRNPRVMLIGRGIILSSFKLEPTELTFGSIPASEGATGRFVIASYYEDKAEAHDLTLTNTALADYFTVDFAPAPAEIVKNWKYAKSALEATVRLKPGLPLGPVAQTIHFKFGTIVDPIGVDLRGTVVSDITINKGGGDFRFENNILVLGTFSRLEGMKADLIVMVKGPDREKVGLKIAKVEPANIVQATLGEKTSQGGGAVNLYPLKVEIIKGAPQVNLAGPPGNEQGVIEIETTHPEAKLIKLLVRFATKD